MLLRKLIHYHANWAYVKYVISGLLSLVIDYTVFAVLLRTFNLPLGVAVFCGMTAGLITGFLLNKLWTFQSSTRTKRTLKQAIFFILLFIFNTLFTYILISILKNAQVDETISKLIAMAFITLWNFYIYKKIIFRT